ncbi:hypothetical protein ACJDU8_23040 [Clostridium sp. WILCCON 0269]|uniref:Uncharacterized protein n=1 Tax=Candidatus Clostridium eludens TaxID=3381663 RepID=A0ABW8SRI1_9CLOT
MYKITTYRFTAQCPYFDELHSINIDYAEIPKLGTRTEYKKIDYWCTEINNCPYPSKDKWRGCPVYLNAPSEPE